MSSKLTKKVVSRKRQRNFVAKALKESPQFKEKTVLDKRSKEDRQNLDTWLKFYDFKEGE